MPRSDDNQYYATRAVQAAQQADATDDPMIAAIHRQLAENYRRLARGFTDARVTLRFVNS